MSVANQLRTQQCNSEIRTQSTQDQGLAQKNVRCNNTFKSSVMDQEMPQQSLLSSHQARSRERLLSARPLTAKIQRASYQDSDIFGYKGCNNPSVQQSASKDDSQIRSRYNPTFKSRVFVEESEETQRPCSRQRQGEKWMSTIFEGPIQEKCNRKKLGQGDKGTETLFGKERIDFENKSNSMAIIGTRKPGKQWKPVRSQKTAEQRKNEELYGRSAAVYGTGKKNDGSLMANNANWRNLQQTHCNSPTKRINESMSRTCKSKKYENLESHLFEGEERNHPTYTTDIDRAAYGSNSNWTAQGGSAKVINKGYKQDPYRKRQQNLASQVFDQTDYSEYCPMKKTSLDINNLDVKQRKTNHLYSNILGSPSAINQQSQRSLGLKSSDLNGMGSQSQQDPKTKTIITVQSQKVNQQKSSLDTHTYDASPIKQQEQELGPQVTISGKPSRATKMRDLSSDILCCGNTIQAYQQSNKPSVVVDLDLKGLNQNTQPADLKKLSGAKHVISSVVDQDSITNMCTGTGRIKVRLGGADEIDNIKLQFLKAGYGVQEHSENPKKKANFTQEQSLQVKSPSRNEIDCKTALANNLNTNNPEVFGNSSSHQNKHSLKNDRGENAQTRQAAQAENQVISTWTKVGGKR